MSLMVPTVERAFPPQPALVHDDGGGKVFDFVHLGLFKFLEPSPDPGRIGLVHLPLAFRGDGVKDDAGFSGAGNPGENHDLFFRDLQGDVFQIVLPQSLDDDFVLMGHSVFSLCYTDFFTTGIWISESHSSSESLFQTPSM